MAFSYDNTDLNVHLNWIRFRIGDTDSTDAQLDDNEITALLDFWQDKQLAAIAAAKAISAKYTRYGAEVEAKAFAELARQIEMEVGPSYL